MPEALGAVLAFGFERLGLNRVEATCEPANRRSARVLAKAGLRCEGVLRDYLFAKGAYLDLQLWAVLRREWQARPREPRRPRPPAPPKRPVGQFRPLRPT